jgi:hypothetical protein
MTRPFTLKSLFPATAMMAMMLGACGDDSTPANVADTAVGGDASTGGDTSNTGPDVAGPDPTLIDPDIRCDRNDFDVQTQSVRVQQGITRYQAVNAMQPPADVLSIEFFAGGEFTGATGPGTYKLDDPNYATCSNCVLIGANCNADTGCQKTFYADAGAIRLDAYDPNGGPFTGRLQGVVLREVTIDEETFESTVVTGGETWCIRDFAFESEVKGLPTSDRTQPNCVAEGTGVYLEDNIRNITYTNCLGEEVKLHDACGQAKAMWFIATAGWCSACADFIASLVEQHGGSLSRAKVAEVTPGLDMLIVLGENRQSAKPTLEYCMEYATAAKLDPAMVVVDWTDAETTVPLVEPDNAAIGTNSLGTTWAAINPYLVADDEGSVASGYPWWALLDARNMRYVWSDYAAREDFAAALTGLLSAP